MQTTDFPTVEYMNMLEWYQKKTKRRKANWLRSRQVLGQEGGAGIGYDRRFGNTNELETRDELYKGNG